MEPVGQWVCFGQRESHAVPTPAHWAVALELPLIKALSCILGFNVGT